LPATCVGVAYTWRMAIQQRTELDHNKNIARRFIDGIFVRQDPAAVEELASADFVGHNWGPGATGREAILQTMQRAGAGVSDVVFTIEDVIAEDDRVAVRVTSSGTHSGTFMGLPATGKRYSIEEIHIFRIRDGKVAEHWHELNAMSLMQQLAADAQRGC
jgi:steroid delta-isomerase-like uncharacterized protein